MRPHSLCSSSTSQQHQNCHTAQLKQALNVGINNHNNKPPFLFLFRLFGNVKVKPYQTRTGMTRLQRGKDTFQRVNKYQRRELVPLITGTTDTGGFSHPECASYRKKKNTNPTHQFSEQLNGTPQAWRVPKGAPCRKGIPESIRQERTSKINSPTSEQTPPCQPECHVQLFLKHPQNTACTPSPPRAAHSHV